MSQDPNPEDLQKDLDKAKIENELLKNKLAQSDEVIAEMQQQIDAQAKVVKSARSFPTVKVDKKEYEIRVNGKVRFKGKDYSAEDIKKSKSVAADLVKCKANFMVPAEGE
jgi:hypothetical protein